MVSFACNACVTYTIVPYTLHTVQYIAHIQNTHHMCTCICRYLRACVRASTMHGNIVSSNH